MPRPRRQKPEPRPAPAPQQPHAAPRATRWKYALSVGGALALLLVLAWHRHPIVTAEPAGRFEDPDATYHARRAMRAVAERSLLPPVFDPAENWPDGGRAVWPPLHDATLALMARLGGSTPDDPGRGMAFAGALPVIEVALVLLLAAALARRFAGDRAGVVAAWLVALTPWMARRGAYGEIDHNMTEALGALALLASAHLAPRGKGLARPLLAAGLWAGAVLLAMGFYTGLLLSAAVVASGAWVVDLLDAGEGPRRSAPLALGFALAALLLPLFASLRVHPDPLDPWRLGPVHALALGLAAAGLALGGAALAARDRAFGAAEKLLLGGAAALGLAAAFLSRAAWGAFGKATGFIGARDPWLATIDEFQPLAASGGFSKAMPAFLVGAALLACALPLLKARAEARRALLPAAVPFAIFLVLTVMQARFVLPAIAFGAVAGGVAWALVRERLLFRGLAWGALAAGVVWGSWLLFGILGATLHPEQAFLDQSWPGEYAGRLLAQATAGRADVSRFGVLAPWDAGHHLLKYSGMPVVLTPFGSMYPGFAPKMRVFLETSPARFVADLDRYRVRWVVITDPLQSVAETAHALGDPRAKWRTDTGPTEATLRAVATRLFLRGAAPEEGDSPADRAALSRLKMLAAPEVKRDALGYPLPAVSLWELAPPS